MVGPVLKINQVIQNMVYTIILSGGTGVRLGGNIPKQYIEVNGKPILYYSIKAFQESFVDKIVLVTGPDHIDYCKKEIVEKYNVGDILKFKKKHPEYQDINIVKLVDPTDHRY